MNKSQCSQKNSYTKCSTTDMFVYFGSCRQVASVVLTSVWWRRPQAPALWYYGTMALWFYGATVVYCRLPPGPGTPHPGYVTPTPHSPPRGRVVEREQWFIIRWVFCVWKGWWVGEGGGLISSLKFMKLDILNFCTSAARICNPHSQLSTRDM